MLSKQSCTRPARTSSSAPSTTLCQLLEHQTRVRLERVQVHLQIQTNSRQAKIDLLPPSPPRSTNHVAHVSLQPALSQDPPHTHNQQVATMTRPVVLVKKFQTKAVAGALCPLSWSQRFRRHVSHGHTSRLPKCLCLPSGHCRSGSGTLVCSGVL